MRTIITFWLLFPLTFISAQTLSSYIHVDQFGYLPNSSKVAVINDPQVGFNSNESYTPGAQLQLRKDGTNQVVFSAAPTIWNEGATHDDSGDRGWWFDFSSINSSGSYHVFDPSTNARSASFEIRSDIYQDVLKAAVRMYYYNRCGAPHEVQHAGAKWADGNSFQQDANTRALSDPNNPALYKDLQGGWFDAGDYNKYVTFAETVIHNLLWAYKENPDAFGDNWNIPESGNGIPDILDELKWELDWLLKMTNEDGSTHIKMGSIDYDENSASPPSANNDPRYYGPTCTAASITVAGALAHAAHLFKSFPSLSTYAQELETEAKAAWSWVLPRLNANNLDEGCDDGTIKSGDADRTADQQKESAVLAAVYLFQLTGESSYGQYVADHYTETEPMHSDGWDNYNVPEVDALFLYTTLPGADAGASNDILSTATASASNNWNNYFGFNDYDLYRGYMPWWTFHWGSNLPKAAMGVLNSVFAKYNIVPSQNASFLKKANEHVHYFHGVNPMGLVYLSNMYDYGAERSLNEIYHSWFWDGTDYDHALNSLYGPAPGFIGGGPNPYYYANPSLTPPYDQPNMKSYLDFNNGYPDQSYEISEPAIYYQAAYVRLVANAVQQVGILPVELPAFRAELIDESIVILEWETSSEENASHFLVERSTDGRIWESINKINASGNSNTIIQYQATDKQPRSGDNYYRLKIVDLDDSFTFSPVEIINRKKRIAFEVYPNPAQSALTIESPAFQNEYQVTMFSITGQEINLSGDLNDQRMTVDVSSLPRGTYFIRLKSDDFSKCEKVILH